jgi:hypothetical protein
LNELINAKALVTHTGIHYRNLFYSCATAVRSRWFETAWEEGEWEIDISYNPNDLNMIYIYNVKSEENETCNTIVRQSESDEKLQHYFESIQKLKALRKEKKAQE